jgi:hypothetical protein
MAFVPTEEEAVPRDPAEGFAAVLALRTLADRLEAGQVERAVAEGWSWTEIAAALGVSRGEQEHLQRYREQMGWEFPWYTLRDDFDADHDVAEWHGTNVFLRDGDEVYRTYFIGARGDEARGSTWSFLDSHLGRLA